MFATCEAPTARITQGIRSRGPTILRAAATALFVGLAAPARAQLNAAVGLHVSTLGFGIEASKLLIPHVAVRAEYNFFRIKANHTLKDVAYDARLRLSNFPVLLDVYPGAHTSFHFTGGVVFNQNKVTAVGKPDAAGSITLNGHSYSTADLGGSLTGEVKYPSAGGYIGIGFGKPAGKSRVGFVFDAGALISTPHLSLTAPNSTTNPTLASDLQAQAATTQSDFNEYGKVFPLLSVGLNVKF